MRENAQIMCIAVLIAIHDVLIAPARPVAAGKTTLSRQVTHTLAKAFAKQHLAFGLDKQGARHPALDCPFHAENRECRQNHALLR